MKMLRCLPFVIFSSLVLVMSDAKAQTDSVSDETNKIILEQRNREKDFLRISSMNFSDGNSYLNVNFGREFELNRQGRLYGDRSVLLTYGVQSKLSIVNILLSDENKFINNYWTNSSNSFRLAGNIRFRESRKKPTRNYEIDSNLHKTILRSRNIENNDYMLFYPSEYYNYIKYIKYWFRFSFGATHRSYYYQENNQIYQKKYNFNELEFSINKFHKMKCTKYQKDPILLWGMPIYLYRSVSYQWKIGLGFKTRHDLYSYYQWKDYNVDLTNTINSNNSSKRIRANQSKSKIFSDWLYLPVSATFYFNSKKGNALGIGIGANFYSMSKISNSKLSKQYDLNADMLGYIIIPFKVQSRVGNVFIKMIQPSLNDPEFRNSSKITGFPIVAVGFTYLQ